MPIARPMLSAVLYVALTLGANAVAPRATAQTTGQTTGQATGQATGQTAGQTPDRDTLMALRAGEMRKLAIPATPRALPTVALRDMQGRMRRLDEFRGRYVLLNFWATWCAPCRAEMPTLQALQRSLAGPRFRVVLVATGRNPESAILRFFSRARITDLETWRDPDMKLSSAMGVFGLPLTVIIDPEGREIARMQGDADWNGRDARAFLEAVLDAGPS